MSGPNSRRTARDFSAAFCRRSALHVPIPAISRSMTNLGIVALPSLLLRPGIVGRVHEPEIGRPHSVHLHHRLLSAHPGEVWVIRRDRGETADRQLTTRALVERLTDPDEEQAGEHRDVLAGLVEVGRDP